MFVRSYHTKDKWIQVIIIRRLGAVNYEVRVGDKMVKRHTDQIVRNQTNTGESKLDNYDYIYDYRFDDTIETRPSPIHSRRLVRA